MIKKLIPQLDKSCRVVGYIYDLADRSLLSEDMISVELPNGFLVSCGWNNEGYSDGAYLIVVTYGLTKKFDITVTTANEAKKNIESLVEEFLEY